MKTALLINDRESREELARAVEAEGGAADEYGTAAKAIGMLGATAYDIILIHWQVRPGKKPSDPKIKELAAMIPVVHMNRNVLYWETALRVIDTLRVEGPPTRPRRSSSSSPASARPSSNPATASRKNRSTPTWPNDNRLP